MNGDNDDHSDSDSSGVASAAIDGSSGLTMSTMKWFEVEGVSNLRLVYYTALLVIARYGNTQLKCSSHWSGWANDRRDKQQQNRFVQKCDHSVVHSNKTQDRLLGFAFERVALTGTPGPVTCSTTFACATWPVFLLFLDLGGLAEGTLTKAGTTAGIMTGESMGLESDD